MSVAAASIASSSCCSSATGGSCHLLFRSHLMQQFHQVALRSQQQGRTSRHHHHHPSYPPMCLVSHPNIKKPITMPSAVTLGVPSKTLTSPTKPRNSTNNSNKKGSSRPMSKKEIRKHSEREEQRRASFEIGSSASATTPFTPIKSSSASSQHQHHRHQSLRSMNLAYRPSPNPFVLSRSFFSSLTGSSSSSASAAEISVASSSSSSHRHPQSQPRSSLRHSHSNKVTSKRAVHQHVAFHEEVGAEDVDDSTSTTSILTDEELETLEQFDDDSLSSYDDDIDDNKDDVHSSTGSRRSYDMFSLASATFLRRTRQQALSPTGTAAGVADESTKSSSVNATKYVKASLDRAIRTTLCNNNTSSSSSSGRRRSFAPPVPEKLRLKRIVQGSPKLDELSDVVYNVFKQRKLRQQREGTASTILEEETIESMARHKQERWSQLPAVLLVTLEHPEKKRQHHHHNKSYRRSNALSKPDPPMNNFYDGRSRDEPTLLIHRSSSSDSMSSNNNSSRAGGSSYGNSTTTESKAHVMTTHDMHDFANGVSSIHRLIHNLEMDAGIGCTWIPSSAPLLQTQAFQQTMGLYEGESTLLGLVMVGAVSSSSSSSNPRDIFGPQEAHALVQDM